MTSETIYTIVFAVLSIVIGAGICWSVLYHYFQTKMYDAFDRGYHYGYLEGIKKRESDDEDN